jgi:hypothetical protein
VTPTPLLLGKYSVIVRGTGSRTVVAEIWHVERNSAGGSLSTPIGWLAVGVDPGGAEHFEHWEASLFLRESRADLQDSELPQAVVEWLKDALQMSEPYVLSVFQFKNDTHLSPGYLSAGKIYDDD